VIAVTFVISCYSAAAILTVASALPLRT